MEQSEKQDSKTESRSTLQYEARNAFSEEAINGIKPIDSSLKRHEVQHQEQEVERYLQQSSQQLAKFIVDGASNGNINFSENTAAKALFQNAEKIGRLDDLLSKTNRTLKGVNSELSLSTTENETRMGDFNFKETSIHLVDSTNSEKPEILGTTKVQSKEPTDRRPVSPGKTSDTMGDTMDVPPLDWCGTGRMPKPNLGDAIDGKLNPSKDGDKELPEMVDELTEIALRGMDDFRFESSEVQELLSEAQKDGKIAELVEKVNANLAEKNPNLKLYLDTSSKKMGDFEFTNSTVTLDDESDPTKIRRPSVEIATKTPVQRGPQFPQITIRPPGVWR